MALLAQPTISRITPVPIFAVALAKARANTMRHGTYSCVIRGVAYELVIEA